jgi:segregation and condensation protein B
MSMELKSVVEAILFAAQSPLSSKEIKNLLAKGDESIAESAELVRAFKKTKEADISGVIQELKVDYTQHGRSFQIQEVAGSFQLISHPQYSPWLKQLFGESHSSRLSQPALETLAIIAYRQPITRADIESIRGVAVDGVMQTLLERGLVTITGRAEVPGRPMLYGTTRVFLERFGMNDLNELPAVEELKKIHLPSATPVAAEPAQANDQTQGEVTDAEVAPVSEGN